MRFNAWASDRLRALVLRDIYRASQSNFQPVTAATEEVDNDLVVLRIEAQAVLGLVVEWLFLSDAIKAPGSFRGC
ncbi:hypothetical protein HX794_23830 [Pseudomonas costantinii]|uniref:hypothetical protein n=1 Tax=Pseudomonas costantinii TaxID=168469 RepID=UPI0015A4AADE|nr:hypothetical protein [Pseudomonas costantinii]NVZ22677.1 hypothetical protein [Pseudomonas costantinii]